MLPSLRIHYLSKSESGGDTRSFRREADHQNIIEKKQTTDSFITHTHTHMCARTHLSQFQAALHHRRLVSRGAGRVDGRRPIHGLEDAVCGHASLSEGSQPGRHLSKTHGADKHTKDGGDHIALVMVCVGTSGAWRWGREVGKGGGGGEVEVRMLLKKAFRMFRQKIRGKAEASTYIYEHIYGELQQRRHRC